MATTIDALVVTLGLDAKGFASGIKGSASELAGFTRRITGMFLAVKSIEDVVGYFQDLHKTLADVGFESRNLGVMGKELTQLGEVSERFGGQAQDAAESVQGLQAAIFGLRFKGEMSESLIMLQRFGIAYLDAQGHARDMIDIARDAARVIDQQGNALGLSGGERYQMALSFGLSGGLASAAAQGAKGFDEALKKSRADQKALSERTIKQQVELSRSLTSLKYVTAANSSAILSTLTPAIHAVTTELSQLVNKWLPLIDTDLKSIDSFFKNPPPWLQDVETRLGLSGKPAPAKETMAGHAADIAKATWKALGGTGLEELGTRILGKKFGFLAAGKEAMQGHFADAIKVIASMLSFEVAGGLMADEVLKNKAPGAAKALDSWSALWSAITGPAFDNWSNLRSWASGTAIPTPNAQRPGQHGGSSLAVVEKGGTSVQIDNIEINTRATDATGIAENINGALRRKLIVSSADGGQQ